MNAYLEMEKRHQDEVNAFPIIFAFRKERLVEGMRELGLGPADMNQICALGGGGYIRKSDKAAYISLLKRHATERMDAINADETGEGFILDMFRYELSNHEYAYTGSADETVEVLGLETEILSNTRLAHGLEVACRLCMESAD